MADNKLSDQYQERSGNGDLTHTTTAASHKVGPDDPDVTPSFGRYLATRIPSLKPPMDKLENPFTLLAMLTFKQWMFFLVAFCGWTWDAFDFFTVSLTVSDLATQFNVSTKDITWGITLVLMSVGTSVGSCVVNVFADECAG
jgi:SHS family lactate transporter-like MFS transporter